MRLHFYTTLRKLNNRQPTKVDT